MNKQKQSTQELLDIFIDTATNKNLELGTKLLKFKDLGNKLNAHSLITTFSQNEIDQIERLLPEFVKLTANEDVKSNYIFKGHLETTCTNLQQARNNQYSTKKIWNVNSRISSAFSYVTSPGKEEFEKVSFVLETLQHLEPKSLTSNDLDYIRALQGTLNGTSSREIYEKISELEHEITQHRSIIEKPDLEEIIKEQNQKKQEDKISKSDGKVSINTDLVNTIRYERKKKTQQDSLTEAEKNGNGEERLNEIIKENNEQLSTQRKQSYDEKVHLRYTLHLEKSDEERKKYYEDMQKLPPGKQKEYLLRIDAITDDALKTTMQNDLKKLCPSLDSMRNYMPSQTQETEVKKPKQEKENSITLSKQNLDELTSFYADIVALPEAEKKEYYLNNIANLDGEQLETVKHAIQQIPDTTVQKAVLDDFATYVLIQTPEPATSKKPKKVNQSKKSHSQSLKQKTQEKPTKVKQPKQSKNNSTKELKQYVATQYSKATTALTQYTSSFYTKYKKYSWKALTLCTFLTGAIAVGTCSDDGEAHTTTLEHELIKPVQEEIVVKQTYSEPYFTKEQPEQIYNPEEKATTRTIDQNNLNKRLNNIRR